MTQPTRNDPCAAPDECIPALRNRYFTGKFMNALDFRIEQDYFVKRRWLHNRLLHGWGIACGLGVEHHEKEACRGRWVVITPGIAIDCRGREIIVREEIRYELPLPRSGEGGKPGAVEPPFLLCIRYDAAEEQPVPSLGDGGSCQSGQMENNSIREGYALEVHRLDEPEIKPECWSKPNDPDAAPKARGWKSARCGCLTPDCPCGEVVPLARISTDDCEPGQFSIDLDGRHSLQTKLLTHICHYNWEHGGSHPAHHFCHRHEHHEHFRLTVSFDRPLRKYQGQARGINEHTFVVQYKGDEEELELVPCHPHVIPYYNEEHRMAVFEIDPHFIDRLRGEITVYVTLRCNFIIDYEGKAVDGDHLKAEVPTGDGVAGGTFESWFRLTKRPVPPEERHTEEGDNR